MSGVCITLVESLGPLTFGLLPLNFSRIDEASLADVSDMRSKGKMPTFIAHFGVRALLEL